MDRMKLSRRATLAFLIALAPLRAAAADDAALGKAEVNRLGPGDWVWRPEPAAVGATTIVISLRRQLAYVYRSGRLIGAATISSGSAGHESPIGRFNILEKAKLHRSNRYSAAPMPFMLRLNWYGVAMHGGNVPGYPASHGCIRLPMGFAKTLFETAGVGDLVFVTEEDVRSPKAALELARDHADDPVGPDRALRMAASKTLSAEDGQSRSGAPSGKKER